MQIESQPADQRAAVGLGRRLELFLPQCGQKKASIGVRTQVELAAGTAVGPAV